nr:MAG TPA: hypothetical protein [Caudoviricetes sp.]
MKKSKDWDCWIIRFVFWIIQSFQRLSPLLIYGKNICMRQIVYCSNLYR